MSDIIENLDNIPTYDTSVYDKPSYRRVNGVIFKIRTAGTKEWERLQKAQKTIKRMQRTGISNDKSLDAAQDEMTKIVLGCITPADVEGNPQKKLEEVAANIKSNKFAWNTFVQDLAEDVMPTMKVENDDEL